jgi:hypothetical protein
VSVHFSVWARRWLLIAATAAGLVAMHHFVAMPMATHDSHSDHMMASATAWLRPTSEIAGVEAPVDMRTKGHASGSDGDASAMGADRPGTDCLGAGGRGCCAMGHPCQAVRTDPTPFPGAVAHATAPVVSHHTASVPAGGVVSYLPARAPPERGARLSQLGVWRN